MRYAQTYYLKLARPAAIARLILRHTLFQMSRSFNSSIQHHWQHWVVYLDNGEQRVLPVPDQYRREMRADWLAVSRNPDRSDIYTWYHRWKEKLILHPKTGEWIEAEIEKRR